MNRDAIPSLHLFLFFFFPSLFISSGLFTSFNWCQPSAASLWKLPVFPLTHSLAPVAQSAQGSGSTLASTPESGSHRQVEPGSPRRLEIVRLLHQTNPGESLFLAPTKRKSMSLRLDRDGLRTWPRSYSRPWQVWHFPGACHQPWRIWIHPHHRECQRRSETQQRSGYDQELQWARDGIGFWHSHLKRER